MARRQLARRRVGSPVIHATLHVMGTRLGHSRGRHVVIAFVDGVLHLLQELIDVEEVALGPHIAHGRQLVLHRLRATVAPTTTGAHGHWSRHRLVFRDGTTAEDGQLQVLQVQQTLTDRRVGVGVELASLQVAKEVVEGIVAAFLRLVSDITGVVALVQGVVNIAIRRVRRLRGMRMVILGRRMIALGRNGVQRRLKVMRSRSIAWVVGAVVSLKTRVMMINGAHVGKHTGIQLGRKQGTKRTFGVSGEHHVGISRAGLGRAHQHRVVGMGFDMLLEILGPFECLAAKVALVRLERDMDTDVRGDVVPFDGGRATTAPLAGQVEIIGALAADMTLTHMFL